MITINGQRITERTFALRLENQDGSLSLMCTTTCTGGCGGEGFEWNLGTFTETYETNSRLIFTPRKDISAELFKVAAGKTSIV